MQRTASYAKVTALLIGVTLIVQNRVGQPLKYMGPLAQHTCNIWGARWLSLKNLHIFGDKSSAAVGVEQSIVSVVMAAHQLRTIQTTSRNISVGH